VTAHRDCVHELPNGAQVDVDGNVTLSGSLVRKLERCNYPIIKRARTSKGQDTTSTSSAPGGSGGGWVEAAWANAPVLQQFVYSDSTFTVPSAPTTPYDGQLIYLFPSIQSPQGIVQPVLQWGYFGGNTSLSGFNGSSGAFGNSWSWTYAAWAVSGSAVFHSPGITVNPGDTLEGTMTALYQDASSTLWEIVARDLTSGASTWVLAYVPAGDNYFDSLWGNAEAGVLEAYGVTNCFDFPSNGSAVFEYPSLSTANYGTPFSGRTDISPNSAMWTSPSFWYPWPQCGYRTVLTNVNYGTTLEF
jgi:hypothetical protein